MLVLVFGPQALCGGRLSHFSPGSDLWETMSTNARNQPRQPKGVPTGGQWRAMARPEGNVVLGEPTGDEWAAAGFSPPEAEAWREAVFLPEEAAEWRDALFEPEEADRWRHALFDAAEAAPWRDAEFEPAEAFEWERAGFESHEAVIWRSSGVVGRSGSVGQGESAPSAPAEAAPWRDAGFGPEEASEWVEAGAKLLGVGDIGPAPNMALMALREETAWVRHDEGRSQCFDGDGRFHSLADLPSVRADDGYRAWHRHGAPHREAGPARSWPDGRREYWERGQRLASYTPPGWEPPAAGPAWRLAKGIWAHTGCPCGSGKSEPAELAEHKAGGAVATCPACGDQVAVPW